MRRRYGHRQVWTKVNVQVDDKMKPLVEALSAFPQLQTADSCKGDGRGNVPVVFFHYGAETTAGTARFVCRLAPTLKRLVGDDAELHLHWNGLAPEAVGELEVQGGDYGMRRVCRALHKLARKWAT